MLGVASTSTQVSSSCSASGRHTCGSPPARAVTFQSIRRTSSSPGGTCTTSSGSEPEPSRSPRWSPAAARAAGGAPRARARRRPPRGAGPVSGGRSWGGHGGSAHPAGAVGSSVAGGAGEPSAAGSGRAIGVLAAGQRGWAPRRGSRARCRAGRRRRRRRRRTAASGGSSRRRRSRRRRPAARRSGRAAARAPGRRPACRARHAG